MVICKENDNLSGMGKCWAELALNLSVSPGITIKSVSSETCFYTWELRVHGNFCRLRWILNGMVLTPMVQLNFSKEKKSCR